MDSVHTEKMVSVPSAEATTSRLYIPNPRISDNNNAFLDYFLDYFDVNNVPSRAQEERGRLVCCIQPEGEEATGREFGSYIEPREVCL